MKVTDQKFYNNTKRYLLPLYDYDYQINNSIIEFLGAFCECPYFYDIRKQYLHILYKVLNIEEAKKINLPDTFKIEFIVVNEINYMIIVLNVPSKFKNDWNLIILGKLDEISYCASNKIQSAYFDKDLMKSILMKSPNISSISKKSLYIFDDRDILDW